jgi:hypothetical protein
MTDMTSQGIRNYITDTIRYHDEYHRGSFETCGYTCCQYARYLKNGQGVPDRVYRAIINGEDTIHEND